MTFDRETIPVYLTEAGFTILMVVRSDQPVEECTVVFADPQKLKPYMDKINAREHPAYLDYKHTEAKKGLALARKPNNDYPAYGEFSSLPMGMINCSRYEDGTIHVGFIDGITRTTELIIQGAEFVPLQINTDKAKLLQELVGGNLPPRLASDYIVPPEIQRERMLTWYRKKRVGLLMPCLQSIHKL